MVSYNVKKSLQKYIFLVLEFLLIAWIVVTVVFFLMNAIRGNEAAIDPSLPKDAQDAIRKALGLDVSVWKRYARYLVDLLTKGQFGISTFIKPGQQVGGFLFQKMLISFQVGFIGLLIGLIVGIPIGIYIGRRPGSLADNLATVFVALAFAVPSFVVGIFLLLFAFKVNIPFIYDNYRPITILLPAIAIAFAQIPFYIRYLRISVNEEASAQYVKFAKIKGCKEKRITWIHTLKPALYPIATVFPIMVLGSLIGSIVVETVFGVPGSGELLVQAVTAKDYNIILAIVLVFCLITSLGYFLRDVLYTILDPRARIN